MCRGGVGRPPLKEAEGRVLCDEEVAPEVRLMTVVCPSCAATVLPGQFVEFGFVETGAELLRLPLSVHGTVPELGAIELMYQVLGEGTRRMSRMQVGETCRILGPIGHGWEVPETASSVLLVSGGLGAAPLAPLARSLALRGITVESIMGAPTAERLVCRDRLAACGEVHVATDDGSEGHHGFCTDVVRERLAAGGVDLVCTCGPQPMQAIVARFALEAGVPCQVSLERMMACGIGACLSCVVDTVDGRRRACVDGPVFDAGKVVW